MSITPNAVTARENARRGSGEFGEQQHSAPEMTLSGMPDLTSHTPVDIDTRLSELYDEVQKAQRPLSYLGKDYERSVKALDKVDVDGERYSGQREYLEKEVHTTRAKIDDIHREVERIKVEAAPYEAEYRRRGGWSRAFLTTGANGHVHSSMHCSTCNREGKATAFSWMTDYSGADEESIVGDAGERACTTCYPTAPAEVLGRPTKMFSADEKRQQEEREERAKAKIERDQKKIANGLTPDGSEFVVRTEPDVDGRMRYPERFKTERAAVMWATDHLGWFKAGDHQPERQAVQAAAIRTIAEAISVKHDRPVEYVLGELQVKADLKTKAITNKQAKERLADLAVEHGVEL